ncbi:hypothetical protein [Roseivirga misakiensis]|uniref:Uncharacterized protein n=1 Tax=Roseivirga misakiensis TaxID=1563681 RepID=A0A1E5SK29_9BACT|nr:hypothetical protein [Roseivirga misakiensis]OEJ99468.1 hypothetical protein BFP71_07730 [Roseivirga misakiensis]
MVLNDPQFNKDKFIKSLESVIYLFLVIPLILFGWVFLEKEKAGELRSVFLEEPDVMFHSVMAIGIGYVLMRTLATWKKDVLKALEKIKEVDIKLQMVRKPIIYRNIMWSVGAGICAYGLYEKGDMVYALVFTLFLILITTNRPSTRYFVKLFGLKGEEKDWFLKQTNQKP